MDVFNQSLYRDLLRSEITGFHLLASNSGMPDSRHIIAHLLSTAKKEIIIFCHKLSSDVYGDMFVINGLKQAYCNNPHLPCVVMIRERMPESSDFLDILLSHGAGVYCDVESDAQGIQLPPDTMIIDRKSARIERPVSTRIGDIIYNPGNNIDPFAEKKLTKAYLALRDLHERIKKQRLSPK